MPHHYLSELWKEEAQVISLEPYFIKVFKQRWYLTARSSAHEELRTYALDRIQELHISNQKFKMSKEFDAEEMYEDAYGIVIGKEER